MGMRQRPRSRAAVSSSSSAWSRAVALDGMPESIRDSSTSAGIARHGDALDRRPRLRLALVDGDLRVGIGGDLREVGHDEHLVRRAQAGEGASHCERGLPADSGVDLVEHQRRRRFGERPGGVRASCAPARHRRRPSRAAPGPRLGWQRTGS